MGNITKEHQNRIVLFWIYAVTIIGFLKPQPLGDIFRFLLYLSIPLTSIFVIKNHSDMNWLKNISWIECTFGAFFIWHIITTCIHGEIMSFGLHILVLISFACVALLHLNNQSIKNEIVSIMATLVFISLILCLFSLILPKIFKYNPDLINTPRFGHESLLKQMISPYSRLNGYYLNPNGTGYLAAIGILASILTIILNSKPLSKIIGFTSIIISSIVLLLTGSRTSMLALLICLMISLIIFIISGLCRKNKTVKYYCYTIVTIFAITIMFLGIVYFTNTDIKQFLKNKLLRLESLKTATGRTAIWNMAIKAFPQHMFLGFSNAGLQEAIAPYYHTHNLMLQIMMLTGIPGLLLIVTTIIGSLAAGFKVIKLNRNKDQETVLHACIAILLIFFFLIHGIFEAGFLYSWDIDVPIMCWSLMLPVHLLHNSKELN